MEILTAFFMMIGTLALWGIGLLYPDFKRWKGEEVAEWKGYGYSLLGVGLFLLLFIVGWLLAN
ncbi:hypothetical protein [Halobacillus sp. Marseille-P3879]|uniref:hypothetical protein n=1 Tax=Halobacillus sp. Marseille-P3879 TaxID=2045014 RepID=UPI000C7E1263|nr:hypothetical protein [Halobacillus sp. Marseille-P3879]